MKTSRSQRRYVFWSSSSKRGYAGTSASWALRVQHAQRNAAVAAGGGTHAPDVQRVVDLPVDRAHLTRRVEQTCQGTPSAHCAPRNGRRRRTLEDVLQDTRGSQTQAHALDGLQRVVDQVRRRLHGAGSARAGADAGKRTSRMLGQMKFMRCCMMSSRLRPGQPSDMSVRVSAGVSARSGGGARRGTHA